MHAVKQINTYEVIPSSIDYFVMFMAPLMMLFAFKNQISFVYSQVSYKSQTHKGMNVYASDREKKTNTVWEKRECFLEY